MKFSTLFHWEKELESLSPVNRAIMKVMNRRLIFFFGFTAIMCFIYPTELAETQLGRFYLFCLALFWFGRTLEQFIYFKTDHPMSRLLGYIFLIGALLFAIPVWL